MSWNNYAFVNPEAFLLLLLIPAIAFWYYWQKGKYYVPMKMPSLESIAGISSWRVDTL